MIRSKSLIAPYAAHLHESKHKGHVFIRSVPETTRAAFKSACSSRGRTMRDVHIFLMRRYAQALKTGKTSINIQNIPTGSGLSSDY